MVYRYVHLFSSQNISYQHIIASFNIDINAVDILLMVNLVLNCYFKASVRFCSGVFHPKHFLLHFKILCIYSLI